MNFNMCGDICRVAVYVDYENDNLYNGRRRCWAVSHHDDGNYYLE